MNPYGKVVLITGGARIGQTVARTLADRGAHLALTYRTSKKNIEEVVSYAHSKGRKAIAIQADLTKKNSISKVLTKIKRTFGRLDILIHMASIYEEAPIKSLREDDWNASVDSNLKSAYLLSLAAAPLIKKSRGGRIIYFSDWTSASGRPRYKNLIPYYIAKSGVIGLTEVLALELAPHILVNTIAPGPILPPPGMNQKEHRSVMQATPLQKWGGADEIGKTVLFLIESDFVTGECIRVDGGRHLC